MYLSRMEQETKEMAQEIERLKLLQQYRDLGASLGLADRLATTQVQGDTDGYNVAYQEMLKEHQTAFISCNKVVEAPQEDVFLKGFWGEDYKKHVAK